MRRRKATGARRFKNSGYSDGAASMTSNAMKSYRPRSFSPESDVDYNLDLLRNRAADLARNSAIGAAIVGTMSRAVIGSGLNGFPRPNHRVLGIDAKAAREWSKRVSDEFNLWTSSLDCDLYRRNDFYDIQWLAFNLSLIDGDCFCLFKRKPPTARNPFSLRLQLLESNRISTPQTGDVIGVNPYGVEGRAANGNRIINGIEIDDDGEMRAIYVSNRVPGDIANGGVVTEWIRVEAFGGGYPNLLQISHDERAGQFRGVPILAPIVEQLKQLSRYTSAELTSAIVRSFFSLFFTQPTNNLDADQILGRGFRDDDSIVDDAALDVSEFSLAAGSLNVLPRGVDVKMIDSSKQTAFESFATTFFRQIGAAVGIPYEVLIKSFNSSYSASRAALLQFNDEVKQRRAWFIRDFTRPIYEIFLAEAIALGRIDAPGFFDDPLIRAAWSNVEWYGAAMSVLDPQREAAASRIRVEQGLSTRRREAAEMGGADFEENLEQLSYEQSLIDAMLPPKE